MKSLDNAKQIFGNAKYALYLAYRTEKKYYLYRGMAAFADTVLTLADVIFPAVIIAYLYPNLYPEHAAFCAVLWGIICLSVRLSKNILEKKTWDSNEKIAMETKLKMDEGVSCIRYEELELSDTQDELAFAKQSVERGSGCDCQHIDRDCRDNGFSLQSDRHFVQSIHFFPVPCGTCPACEFPYKRPAGKCTL